MFKIGRFWVALSLSLLLWSCTGSYDNNVSPSSEIRKERLSNGRAYVVFEPEPGIVCVSMSQGGASCVKR